MTDLAGYYEQSYPPSIWAPVAPVLASIAPSSMVISTSGTVTATGSGFVSGDQIVIGGTARTTTFVSATELTAAYTAPGTAQTVPVLVRGAGGDSASQDLTITATGVQESFAAIPVDTVPPDATTEPPPE